MGTIIILDCERRVAVYSGDDEKQGMVLPDAVSQHAAQASTMLIQYVPHTKGAAEHYDIAVPVFVPGNSDKWGTVRVVTLGIFCGEVVSTEEESVE